MNLTFDINGWRAWMPGVATEQQWSDWAAGRQMEQAHQEPDVSMIPAMLRRRLSPMARAATSVLVPLLQEHGALPIIYASRHGEVEKSVSLLQDIARQEPVSPATFSLSVHNAIAGMLSIQQSLTQPITAIAACGDELQAALVESMGMLASGSEKVICLFCDNPVPSIYQSGLGPEIPYACAMVLQTGKSMQLQLVGSRIDTGQLPEPLALIQWLVGKEQTFSSGLLRITRQ